MTDSEFRHTKIEGADHIDPVLAPGTPADPRSLGELVAAASRDLSSLVHMEVELAKTELKRTGMVAGIGAGFFGAAGGLGAVAGLFILVTIALAIALALPLWAGFLIVAGALLAAAGLLAMIGKKALAKVSPPRRTLATVKDDLAWAKHPTQAPEPTPAEASSA